MGKRHVTSGTQVQGEDEGIIYSVDVTPWGNAPTAVAVVVKDITNQNAVTDVTATTTTGSASVLGNVITLPKLHSLTARHKYQVEIAFTDAGDNDFEALMEVWTEE
jgi:hypothetical protein